MERIVVDLARESAKHDQDVSVLCLERPGVLAGAAEACGAPVYCINKGPGIHWSTFARTRAVLRDIQPDVIHSHTIGALFYCGPAVRSLGVPLLVHTEHMNNIGNPLTSAQALRRQKLLWRWSARYCRRFFCVSRDINEALTLHRLVPNDKLCVLVNGIDISQAANATDTAGLRRSLSIPVEARIIGNVARLQPIKRHDLLVRAFARVRVQFPETHLLLVGDGPCRTQIEDLVNQLGLTQSVSLVGYQAETQPYYQIMDVFALTSALEGTPLVLLEAWSAGLPAIASAVGGVPDLITHGANGLLFPPGDEDALVAGLTELLAAPDRARRMGEIARQEVRERYSLHRMADEYNRHYQSLLNGVSG